MATEQNQKLITITAKAAEKISEFMKEEKESPQFLRIYVQGGGLSDCEELVGVIHRRNWAKFAERIAACFFAGYLSSWN